VKATTWFNKHLTTGFSRHSAFLFKFTWIQICFMKIYTSLFFLFFGLKGLGQTQQEMNEAAQAKFNQADKQLNIVYKKILTSYSRDTNFIVQLKTSQRIWIQFRDAEMKMKFPEKDQSNYGSVFPLCWYAYMEELTAERTKKLKQWLTGAKEGEVCNGSIKTL
jgi:uncharacterized protein YecT (DUF1311 family)